MNILCNYVFVLLNSHSIIIQKFKEVYEENKYADLTSILQICIYALNTYIHVYQNTQYCFLANVYTYSFNSSKANTSLYCTSALLPYYL